MKPKTRLSSRYLQVLACLIAVLTTGMAWFIFRPEQNETRLPPALDSVQDRQVDPAIHDAVRLARQDVLVDLNSPDRWGHLGMVFAAHGFNDRAAECFATASELAPRNQQWAYLHARCKESSSPEESLALLEQCIDLEEDPLDTARLYLVEKLMETHQLDKAQKHLDQALSNHPENARARFAKARLHFLREEYEACRNQIITSNLEIKKAYQAEVERSKIIVAEGRSVEAKSIVDAANERLHASLCQQKTIGTMLANAMRRLGDVEGGRKQQELASQQADTKWPDRFTRGLADLKTGLRTMLSECDIAHRQERYADALDILNRAVDQYPDSLFARIRLGRTRIRLGRMAQEAKNEQAALAHYREAEKQLDAALSIDANSVEAHFRRGVLILYWSEFPGDARPVEEAEQYFRSAIAIKPDFHMAYYNLARCLDRQRKAIAAIAAMREAVKLDPSNLPARRGLGGLLMKAGRLREAITELEQVIEAQPDDKQVRGWLDMMRRDLHSS